MKTWEWIALAVGILLLFGKPNLIGGITPPSETGTPLPTAIPVSSISSPYYVPGGLFR